jgi:hypothetical protein
MKFSKTSLVLLLIQLALVSSVAAKYLYQRRSCPRVWVPTRMWDPYILMRGRYLSLNLTVDGCGNTYQTPNQLKITQTAPYAVIDSFQAKLSVKDNRLVATRIPGAGPGNWNPMVIVRGGESCDALRLWPPVNFYISEHAAVPTPIHPGQELWIEVTVPPKGLPRPIQLALKNGGAWKPLAFQ